jgi:hypothetical protein
MMLHGHQHAGEQTITMPEGQALSLAGKEERGRGEESAAASSTAPALRNGSVQVKNMSTSVRSEGGEEQWNIIANVCPALHPIHWAHVPGFFGDCSSSSKYSKLE